MCTDGGVVSVFVPLSIFVCVSVCVLKEWVWVWGERPLYSPVGPALSSPE